MQNSNFLDDAGVQRLWAKIKAAIAAASSESASINIAHPIGSIYISADNVNPSTLFSGTTWVAVDIFVSGSSDVTTYSFKRTA